MPGYYEELLVPTREALRKIPELEVAVWRFFLSPKLSYCWGRPADAFIGRV